MIAEVLLVLALVFDRYSLVLGVPSRPSVGFDNEVSTRSCPEACKKERREGKGERTSRSRPSIVQVHFGTPFPLSKSTLSSFPSSPSACFCCHS